MPLSFDSSRAARTRGELTSLVEAIAQAPASEQETDSIEWKSTFDLRGQADHKFEAAKHILGFGNRNPDVADASFEGCGYLVLGAAPQSVGGIAVEDIADLEAWIGPYVAADGPRWGADYVEARGKDVLVITIEAPRWGDHMHPLAKGFGSFLPGQLFIRRAGKTVPPDVVELRMLEERGQKAKSQLSLEVDLCDPSVEFKRFQATSQDKEMWLERESERLWGPLQRAREERYGIPSSLISGEIRGPDEYKREVERYLATAHKRWWTHVLEGAVQHQLAPLRICITNPTDRNFASVQVVIQLPDHAYPFFDEDGPARLLDSDEPPEPWGEGLKVPMSHFDRGYDAEGEVTQEGAAFRVAFSPVHVRPHRREHLPAVYLALPHDHHEGEIEIAWQVTSTSVDGSIPGTIRVPIAGGYVRGPDII